MLSIIKVVIIVVLVIGAITGIIVGIIFGIKSTVSDDECQNIKPPSDIKIELMRNFVNIRWSRSISNCDLYYRVTAQIEGHEPVQGETNWRSIMIPITLIYCSTIEVTVMAVGEKSKSDIVTKSRPTTPNQEDINAIRISYHLFNPRTRELRWGVDRSFRGCDPEYQLTINEHEPFKTKETIYQLPEDKMNPVCQDNDVKIKVIVDGVGGEEQEINREIIVAPSETEAKDVDVAFEDFDPDTKLLSWTIIDNPFLECTIRYFLFINDLRPIRVESNSFDLQTVQLNSACENNEVWVILEIQSMLGREKQYDGRIVVDPTVEEVQDATVIFDDFNSETRILSWNLNRLFIECTVAYDVTVNNLPPRRVETNSFDLYYVLLNPVCENNDVRVTPEVQSIQGSDHQYGGTITVEPSFIPIVQNSLTEFWEIDRSVRISWKPPLGLEACELTYNVHLRGNHGETLLHYGLDLVEREFTYEPIPISENCGTIQVSILAKFRNISGTSLNFVTCITNPPRINI